MRDYPLFNDYLYIDDIVLTEINACESQCLGDNAREDIEVFNLIPKYSNTFNIQRVDNNTTLLNSNGIVKSDFKIMMTNAMYYKIEIFDGWGGKQYSYSVKDMNILEDNDGFYPDTTVFRWWGTSQSGVPLLPNTQNADYLVTINAKNCMYSKNYSTSLTFLHLTFINNFTDIKSQYVVDTLENCCPDQIVFNDHFHNVSLRESADRYIFAATSEEVIVDSGVFVSYNAGKEIVLGSGFKVEAGGEFSAKILHCELNHYKNWKKEPVSKHRTPFNEFLKLEEVNEWQKGIGKIYPNPANKVLMIESDQELGYNITDLNGRRIISGELKPELNEVDISSLAKGVYFIILYNSHAKIFVKH